MPKSTEEPETPPAAIAPLPANERPPFLKGVRAALSAGTAAGPASGGAALGLCPLSGGRGPGRRRTAAGGVGAMAESDWDTVTVLRKKGPSAAQAKSKQVSGWLVMGSSGAAWAWVWAWA